MSAVTELSARSESNSAGWPELLPLRKELPAPEPFPTDALPGAARGMCDLMRLSIQAPDSLCGQSLLAAVALAAQAHADVHIDGRVIPLNQYFVGIGGSGERKSACDRAALAPHLVWEAAAQEIADKERQAYVLKKMKWDRQLEHQAAVSHEASSDNSAQAPEEGNPPQQPLYPFIRCEEPTLEGLTKLLYEYWPSTGLLSDEGGRFLGGIAMSAQNRLKTSAGLSSLWDSGCATRVRATEPPQSMRGRRVSLHLLIQPMPADLLFADPQLADQGLLSRVLATMPVSTIGYRPYSAIDIATSHEALNYGQAVKHLLEMPLPLRGESRLELNPRALILAPASKELWTKYHDHLECLMRPGGPLELIKGFTAKAAEHALRFGGARAIFCNPDAHVLSREHIEAAICLTDYYSNEKLRLANGVSADPRLDLAERCYLYIRSRPRRTVALRDLIQYGPNAIRKKDIAEELLALLESHGWVRHLPGSQMVNGRATKQAWEARDVAFSTL